MRHVKNLHVRGNYFILF